MNSTWALCKIQINDVPVFLLHGFPKRAFDEHPQQPCRMQERECKSGIEPLQDTLSPHGLYIFTRPAEGSINTL